MRGHLAGDRQALRLGSGDQLDLLFAADVAEMHVLVESGGQADAGGDRAPFGVHGDGLIALPVLEASFQVLQLGGAQRAEGLIHVDFKTNCLMGKFRQLV